MHFIVLKPMITSLVASCSFYFPKAAYKRTIRILKSAYLFYVKDITVIAEPQMNGWFLKWAAWLSVSLGAD